MKYDITIIGAGIVGLATAYTILKMNPDIRLLLIEKENEVAKHQTGNNSGVIYSGLLCYISKIKPKLSYN